MRDKRMTIGEMISIGKNLPKSRGYYDWCKRHHINPETAELENEV